MSGKTAMKQESFLINDESLSRRKIIRQDRMPLQPGRCFLYFDKMKVEVLNISPFGVACVVKPGEVTSLKNIWEKLDKTQIPMVYNDVQTQLLHLHLVREHVHPQSAFGDLVFGFEVVGDLLHVDRLLALEATHEMLAEQNAIAQVTAMIPNEFKLLVYEMREWLTSLKHKIDLIEAKAPVDNAADNLEFKLTVAEAVSEYLGKVIPTKYQDIPSILKGKDETVIAASTKFIRDHIGAMVYGAPFAYRAYSKPRGYAGDYEMMNHLYRDEMVGRSLFDQCMHKYFVDEPAGQAVKNRGYYLLEKIKETVKNSKNDTIRILAVASGPAMEQQLFLRDCKEFHGKNIEFLCIDQDEESLKHAQRQAQSIERFVNSGFKFRYSNLAIKNILGRGLPEGDFDLIYSAGLFDYFSDPVAQAAGVKLFGGLAPGGRLIIGNFSTLNPCVPFMEMVLDWHLIYRSPEVMQKLFAPLSSKVRIEEEPLKINIFAVIEK
jgi:SAM-dependent methyltransferase